LWSASYDRDLRDALEVQTDVARQIGKALAPELLAHLAWPGLEVIS
jgi:TolB-like protein